MINENKIREILEQIDPDGKIPSSKIEELISTIKDQEEHPLKDGDKVGDAIYSTLEEQLKNEPDWKKRAIIAAKIISHNLNE